MRKLSSDLKQRLATGVTTTCLCWRLSRADGFIVGLTEHDQALSVDGIEYKPGGVSAGGSFTQSVALKPGQASASGVLSSAAISEEDLAAGLWSDAKIDVLRVDWRRPDLFWTVWSGRLSNLHHGELGFQAELVSLKADLERPVGRLYGRQCDAVLGDARCGLDLSVLPSDAACDGTWSTCRSIFQNTDNFRGMPHMPGNDFVLAGPASVGNDGGAR